MLPFVISSWIGVGLLIIVLILVSILSIFGFKSVDEYLNQKYNNPKEVASIGAIVKIFLWSVIGIITGMKVFRIWLFFFYWKRFR